MACCVILQNMIVDDEFEEAARTHVFEKHEEHFSLSKQDKQVVHFLEINL